LTVNNENGIMIERHKDAQWFTGGRLKALNLATNNEQITIDNVS